MEDCKEVVNYNLNGISGNLYIKNNTGRGAIFVHGLAGNRYAMSGLARELAKRGITSFCFDLPSHFTNEKDLTLSLISETIIKSVQGFNQMGIKNIAIIGHSLGGMGALFALAGYNTACEKEMFDKWQELGKKVDDFNHKAKKIINEGKLSETEKSRLVASNLVFLEKEYLEIREIIKTHITEAYSSLESVKCYVLLSTISEFPGSGIYRKLGQKLSTPVIRYIFREFMHRPGLKVIQEEQKSHHLSHEGKPLEQYLKKETKESIEWAYFQANAATQFVGYLVKMQEPKDYLKIVEGLAEIEKNKFNLDDKPYLNLYLGQIKAIPKLFIYGKNDKAIFTSPADFLVPVIHRLNHKSLERYYESWSNAKIVTGNFTHILSDNPKEHDALLVGKNKGLAARIINFVYQYT